jgi:hypothetical protein
VVAALLAVAAAGALFTASASSASGGGDVRGMAVPRATSVVEYDRLHADGVNTISLEVWWMADSPTANSVHPDYPDNLTASDAELLAEITNARNAGMNVTLTPKVYCNGCTHGWRGQLEPGDPQAFMTSYGSMVSHYAQVAQQGSVWLYFLGSEMNNQQGDSNDWRTIATSVRRMYTGQIAYQVNWDRVPTVTFWDAVDVVSVSAYFPLTETPQPSVDDLKAAWHNSGVGVWKGNDWVSQVAGLSQKTGRRVLFGEAGYRSGQSATEFPWDEGSVESNDQAVQANAYQALMDTFGNQPWWMGVMWWEWRPSPNAATDTDMSPRDKLAEQTMVRWWVTGDLPGAPGPAGAGAASPRKGPTQSGGAGHAATATTGGRGPATSAGGATAAASTSSTAALGDAPSGSFEEAAPAHRRVAAKPSSKHAGRDVAVAVAITAVFGAGATAVALGLRRLRTIALPGS